MNLAQINQILLQKQKLQIQSQQSALKVAQKEQLAKLQRKSLSQQKQQGYNKYQGQQYTKFKALAIDGSQNSQNGSQAHSQNGHQNLKLIEEIKKQDDGKRPGLFLTIKNLSKQKFGCFVFLSIYFFAASASQSLLQAQRDTLILSYAGPEAIPYLGLLLLFAAFAQQQYYLYMINKIEPKFHSGLMLIPLVSIVALFGFVLYPNINNLQPKLTYLYAHVPKGFTGFLKIIQFWTITLFYLASEMWGSVTIALLFWGKVTDVFKKEEFRNLAAKLPIVANLGMVFSGMLLSKISSTYGFQETNIIVACAIIMFSVVMLFCLFKTDTLRINRINEKHPEYQIPPNQPKKYIAPKISRSNSTIQETRDIVRKDKLVMCVLLIVVGYSLAHRFFEYSWKSSVKAAFSKPGDIQQFMSVIQQLTGATSLVLVMFNHQIYKLGFVPAFGTTPFLIGISGIAFFILASMKTPQALRYAVIVGGITQVSARACKFALFDIYKEDLYTIFNDTYKKKVKGIVDMVGANLGKVGVSLATAAITAFAGSAQNSVPLLFTLFVLVIGLWLGAILFMDKQIKLQQLQSVRQERKEQRQAKLLNKNGNIDGNNDDNVQGVMAAQTTH